MLTSNHLQCSLSFFPVLLAYDDYNVRRVRARIVFTHIATAASVSWLYIMTFIAFGKLALWQLVPLRFRRHLPLLYRSAHCPSINRRTLEAF